MIRVGQKIKNLKMQSKARITSDGQLFLLPMYDTSFFTIFQAHHYADHPMHDFHQPTTHPPSTQLFVTPCMIHHFSQFFKPIIMLIIQCMTSTTHPPPTHPTTTHLTFYFPMYDTLFLMIFQAQHYADHPVHDFQHPTAIHPIFCFPMYDTSFFTIYRAHLYADHPMHDFHHPPATHPPPPTQLFVTPCMIHHF